ncbi:hypothetical protein FDECE_16280 [Fusarium decemcellulare]|nr:hypothetical protein FDECE_16280 [Fusarium decemcellulare]
MGETQGQAPGHQGTEREELEEELATKFGDGARVEECGSERKNHFIQTSIEDAESDGRRPESVVWNEDLGAGGYNDSALLGNTCISSHVTLQKLSLQCTNDTEEKPSGVGAVVGRRTSQLRRKWAWSRKQDLLSPRIHPLQSARNNYTVRSLPKAGGETQPPRESTDDSSDSPVDDWEALYSSDDTTHEPRDNDIGRPSRPIEHPLKGGRRWRKSSESSSDDCSDSDHEELHEPWIAVCTVGIRVYSKDRDLVLLTVEDGVLLEEVRMKRTA